MDKIYVCEMGVEAREGRMSYQEEFDDTLFDIADEYRDELYDLWMRDYHPEKAKPEPTPKVKKKERKKKIDGMLGSDGWVYLVEGAGLYKIGVTVDLENRMNGLQAQSPVRLRLIHSIKSRRYREVEKYFHRVFENTRKHYEWFALFDSDVRQIMAYGDYDLDDLDLD